MYVQKQYDGDKALQSLQSLPSEDRSTPDVSADQEHGPENKTDDARLASSVTAKPILDNTMDRTGDNANLLTSVEEFGRVFNDREMDIEFLHRRISDLKHALGISKNREIARCLNVVVEAADLVRIRKKLVVTKYEDLYRRTKDQEEQRKSTTDEPKFGKSVKKVENKTDFTQTQPGENNKSQFLDQNFLKSNNVKSNVEMLSKIPVVTSDRIEQQWQMETRESSKLQTSHMISRENRQTTKKPQDPIITISEQSQTKTISDNIKTSCTAPDAETSTPHLRTITNHAVLSTESITVIANHTKTEKSQVISTKPIRYDDTMEIPPKNVQQEIVFIFNNLNGENVKPKCAEIKKNLKRKYLPWLANYLVTKRISNESQLITLYFTCLEYFNSDVLNELIAFETTKYIKILLTNYKTTQNKHLLKNMGHWLGMITLAKDKLVPFDLKTLVVDTDVRGADELEIILPFVANILKSCVKSEVYGAKSPWTLSIMRLLSEIYRKSDLQLCLKSEIELLSKMLNFELKCTISDEKLQKLENVQKTNLSMLQEQRKMVIYDVKSNSAKPDAVESVLRQPITTQAVTPTEPFIEISKRTENLLTTSPTSRHNSDSMMMMIPPEDVQQKIKYIFKNIHQEIVETECAKVKKILTRKYLPWLSEYLVTKFISYEFKSHSLYIACLECLNNDLLNDLIELETTKNIKTLLTKRKSNNTKYQLNNLGHWLGLITLAKDRPIPLDLAEIVEKADSCNELPYVLPFIALILESCNKSVMYCPKSPWTQSVLSKLAELHKKPGLQFILKYEIVLLCKVLDVQLKELPGYKCPKTL